MKVIKYYRTKQYGTTREFIHPSCDGDAKIRGEMRAEGFTGLVLNQTIAMSDCPHQS